MSTTIQIKRSSTASAVPLSGDLAVGELAVNLADKRLFAKQADGTIIELSTNPTDLDAATLRIDGVEITASATELNSLDGLTATTAELNILDGVTATATEINVLDGITSTTTELNKLDGFTGSTAELNLLDGVTATTAELNFVDGVTSNVQTQLNAKQPLDAQLTDIAGLTPTDGSFIVGNGANFVAESGNTAIASLGVTATAAELNTLDGVTATTTELNYTDGVTSNIQTQLNSKAATTTSPTITLAGDLSGSATLTNLGNATLTATVADDSHNHVISNVDGLQTALNSKANLSGANFTGSVDVTGTITADGLVAENSTNSTLTLKSTKNGVWATDEVLGRIDFYGSDTSGSGASNKVSLVVESKDIYGAAFDLEIKTDNGLIGATKTATFANNGNVSFYEDTGTTAKFVWDASAESLGIGVSSINNKLHIATDTNGTGLTLQRNSLTSGDFTELSFNMSDNSVGDPNLWMRGYRGSSFATNYLTFGTNNSERARIDSSGNLLVGTTTASGAGISLYPSAFYASVKTGTSAATHIQFSNGNGVVGSIVTNGTTTSYNTSSDERLKENIQDTTHTVDINNICVREFDWKVDGEHQRFGFIAQELEIVYPEAVHSPEDPEEMKSVDYSKLVPLLVKEIQKLKARIEELEK